MAKVYRAAAPLLAVAVLVLIPLLMLSAEYVAAQWRSEVVVYSARIEQLIKPMFDAFTEKTGIPVKYFTAGEKELFERLHSEGTHTPADVRLVHTGGIMRRVERRSTPLLQLRMISASPWRHVNTVNSLMAGLE
jgi:ABC-type thiamine transport system substrate-binding protein